MISPVTMSAPIVGMEKLAASQAGETPDKAPVTLNLSASKDVFGAVDDFFNLGKEGRLDAYNALGPEEKEQFIQIVAKLAKNGYMGYEILDINGHPEKHDVDLQISDERTRNAPIYDESGQII